MPILPFKQQKPQRSAPTVTSIGQVALGTKKVSGGTELKITPKYDNPTLMSKLYSFWVQALYLDICSDRFERKQICMYNIRWQKSVFFFRHFFFGWQETTSSKFWLQLILLSTPFICSTLHITIFTPTQWQHLILDNVHLHNLSDNSP